jgi:hypothetical protein
MNSNERFPGGSIVICIDNLKDDEDDPFATVELTLYKKYTVLNNPNFQMVGIEIRNDSGNHRFYHSNRFLTMKQFRQKKISEFLTDD